MFQRSWYFWVFALKRSCGSNPKNTAKPVLWTSFYSYETEKFWKLKSFSDNLHFHPGPDMMWHNKSILTLVVFLNNASALLEMLKTKQKTSLWFLWDCRKVLSLFVGTFSWEVLWLRQGKCKPGGNVLKTKVGKYLKKTILDRVGISNSQ